LKPNKNHWTLSDNNYKSNTFKHSSCTCN